MYNFKKYAEQVAWNNGLHGHSVAYCYLIDSRINFRIGSCAGGFQIDRSKKGLKKRVIERLSSHPFFQR